MMRDMETASEAVGTGPSLATGVVPTREYRAKWTFAVTALFTFVAMFFVSAAGYGGEPLGLVLGPFLGVVVYAVAAAAVESGSPAGRFAMDPLLKILIAEGVISMVLALLHSTLLFPVGAILAWYALRAAPSARLGPPPTASGFGSVLILGAALSAVFVVLGSF
jgi:hypothetical protein